MNGRRGRSGRAGGEQGRGQSSASLRIDGLLFVADHAAHLELAVLDREGEAALDQVERVLAELLEPPALTGS